MIRPLLPLLAALAACGGSPTGYLPETREALTERDAGPDAPALPFVGCRVLSPDPDGGAYDVPHDYDCSSPEIMSLQWGYLGSGEGFAGSCSAAPMVGCVYGSPCVVTTATDYVQGGCY